MILLFLINALIILNAYFLVRLFFYSQPGLDRAITWFIIFYAQIILILQVLGIFGKLYSYNIVIACLLIFLAGFTAWRLLPHKKSGEFWHLGFEFLSKLSKLERLTLAVIAGFAVVKLTINFFNPPFGWDDLNYHFTYPAEWLKKGYFDSPISVFGDPSVSYYPINGSLFYFWFMFPLKNVFIADLGQFPFFVFLFLAIYSLSRKLGISSRYSLFAAGLFSIIPNYFKQLEIAYIDIMVAALFMISLNFLFSAAQTISPKPLFLSALSIGLMLGTKTTAMPLALLLIFGMILVIVFSFRKKIIYSLFLCGAAIIIFGGFSYIRNFFVTGNPLYPLNFRLFGLTFFKGVIDNSVYRTAISPGDFSARKLLFSEGLGGQTLLFVAPLILLSPISAFSKKIIDLKPYYFKRFLLVLPLLIFLVFRVVLPAPNVRYVYCLLAVSLIIAFYLLERFSVPSKIVSAIVFLCILASIAEIAKYSELIVSLVISLAAYIASPYIIAFLRRSFLTKASLILTGTLLLLPLAEKDYVKNEYPRYLKMTYYSGFWPDAARAWIWLNDNTDSNNIAYTGTPVVFPLYGSNFKNNVYYVSVNAVEPAMLHYFPESEYIWEFKDNLWTNNFEERNNYRGNADYNVWLRNLKKNKTDYLFIYSGLSEKGIEFPLEGEWAKAHPAQFNPIFANNKAHIYKVIK